MKVCLGLISIVICVFISFRLSRKFLEKRKFYQSFVTFNESFKEEVLFRQTLLYDLIEEIKNEEGVFYEAIYQFYFDKVNNKKKIEFLSSEETDYFYNYLSVLGRGDKDSQLAFLSETNKYIEDKFNSSLNDEKKYKNLYIKIGFLIGLIIFIIFL